VAGPRLGATASSSPPCSSWPCSVPSRQLIRVWHSLSPASTGASPCCNGDSEVMHLVHGQTGKNITKKARRDLGWVKIFANLDPCRGGSLQARSCLAMPLWWELLRGDAGRAGIKPTSLPVAAGRCLSVSLWHCWGRVLGTGVSGEGAGGWCLGGKRRHWPCARLCGQG